MNTDSPSIAEPHRRRRHYVDNSVQGRLLIALIVLEVVLFGVAMFVVYADMNSAIEDSLYRIHQVAGGGRPVLLDTLLHIVPWLVLINIVALVIADRFWNAYVNSIVKPLRQLLASAASLDLRDKADIDERHEVLKSGRKWIRYERERCWKIREAVDSLSTDIEPADAAALSKASAILSRIRRLLP